MISQKKVAVLTAVLLVPVLLIVASAALAQEPVYIAKSDSPDPVYAGEELFYEIFITPPDPGLWWITDTLPPEVTYISDTLEPIPVPGYTEVITEGCQLVGNELGCMLFGGWEPRSFQIKTRVAPDAVAALDTGTVVANNVAWLAYYDPVNGPEEPGPFAAEGTFIEDLADLLVVKMSKPDTHVQAGELFTYTIFVENLGPSYARNVSIRDEILSSGAFTVTEVLGDPNREDACYVAPAGQIPEGPGETIECDLLDPLEPKDVFGRGRWVIQVVLSANETQDVNNLVNVFSGDPDGPEGPGMPTADPDLSNNLAEDFIYVTDVANLSVTKGLDWCDEPEGQCVAGGKASFNISVYNDGPSTAENVVVEDLLPSGVTVVSVSGEGACTTGIPGDPFAPLTCNLGSFAPLERKSFDVEVRIDPDYVDAELPSDYRELENDAWVYSDIFDPDNDNNRDHVIIRVYTYSELAITKWGFPDVVVPGEEMEYEIRVRNAGPSTVDMLHFVDLLPDGVTYLDYWIEQGTGSCTYHDSLPWPWWQDFRGVHCYLDEIPPNGINMVHLQVLVNSDVDWDADFYDVCNIIPDDDPFGGGDNIGVDDPFDFPQVGWFADSRIDIPFEWSQIFSDTLEYFGWCPDELTLEADLSIDKTSEPPKIYPGEQKVYHITVANNGPADAPGVMVTDTLPIELHYQIDTDNCDLVSAGPPEVLECDLGTIPAGESVQFDIHALVAPDYMVTAPVEITNTAQVSMTTDLVLDPDPANNTDTATNLILPPDVADLELTKSIFPPPRPPFYAGNNMRFRLQVTNNGPSTAENVVVEDLLPAGVTVVSVKDGPGPASNPLPCNTGIPGDPLAPLACGLGDLVDTGSASAWVTVRIDPDYLGTLENDAWVHSDIFDPNNSNDRAYVIVQVQTLADLTLNKNALPPLPWRAGEIRTYRYNINNNGPSVSRDVRLRDFLPDEVEFVSAYAFKEGSTGGIPLPCNVSAASVLICPLGDIPPTDPPGVVVLVDVYIKPDVPDGTTIWNNADLITDTSDPGGAWDDVGMQISNETDLSIWKEADPWKVYAGEQVRYDIEVTNNGPGTAGNVLVTDTLPISVTYEIDTDDCLQVGETNTYTCTLGTIPPGETRNFSIFARVDPGAQLGPVSNVAMVDSPSDPYNWPDDYNDRDTAPTLIQGKADLRVLKYGKPDGIVEADDRLTYTVIVDNLGPGYAHDVVLYDLFSSSSWAYYVDDWRSDRPADCSWDEWGRDTRITCHLDDPLEVMSPSSSGRWVLKFYLEVFEEQSVNNVAQVVGSDEDPDLSNNYAIVEHEITAVADLELDKEAWGEVLVDCGDTDWWEDEVAAGGELEYRLYVYNDGPSEAENVVVEDWGLSPFLDIVQVECEKDDSWRSCSCNLSGLGELGDTNRHLICYLGEIDEDDEDQITITARIPSDVPEGTRLVNDARVYSDVFDDDNGDNLDTNWTTVLATADLEVEKTQDMVALPGFEVTYSITVTNLGPSDAHEVMISDTLPFTPTTMTMECCASDGGDCDVECEVPTCPQGECPWPEVDFIAQADIPAGEWVIYTLAVTPEWVPCEPITNTVEVVAPQSVVYEDDIDPCDDNNIAYSVSDPECNFVPLALKNYPAPDTTP